MAILSPHLIISNTGDISVTRGVDVAFSVTFKANDVAVDLTGYTVYFTVRKNQDVTDADDSEAIISQEYTSIANPATGIVTISLSKTELKQNVGEYFYGIDFKNGSGAVTKGFEGKFNITYNSANRTS
jgi:hypothetical protein